MVSNQTQPKHNTVFTIDKRSNLSRADLIKEYVEPSIPVILTDAQTKNWNLKKYNPQYFKSNYGNLVKRIDGVDYKLTDVLDTIVENNPDKRAPYPFNFDMQLHFPGLLQELKPEILYAKSDRVNHPLLPKFLLYNTTPYEIFFGGKGSFFPFVHTDALSLHTQITQLYGSKEFILFPPEQTMFMYPSSENPNFSPVDIFSPHYEKHPLFKNAKPIRVTLDEGETILFPSGWWHSTQIYEPCISYGRIQLNAANWDAFIADNYRVLKERFSFLASSLFVYGKIVGGIMKIQESKR